MAFSKQTFIDFMGYPEKPREDLLLMVRKLHEADSAVRPLLEITMTAQDFALIRN
ncbi:hypothetical protein PDIG_21920 [Penicillium digitatum PHI26]|uniref:Uncharacterized protein n=2 Tax=Penicillium digitatum TaxID=36651 RepID=K9GSQ6_PEND2|nr:hypothetical protein PDIP_24200 [Penicillium digitatum Pd1]EKV16126.1 hypothetical protein PDIG_21920 [Penicillium digitatum PHI26]EKV19410.1 hypothetical protein PDIP_24200 [Penicillium digitatum Pd1]